MIPKIIHYCWFGGANKPELVNRCIESWKINCPDYEIREWNETNSPIMSNTFAEEAFSKKKWAFVADYVRLWALYEYGGIYCDTDVEILQPIDKFLANEGFLGYADDVYINPAMFGFCKGNALCERFLNYYNNRHFILKDGEFDQKPNNEIYTDICVNEMNFSPGDETISPGNVTIYPSSYFSPYKKRIFGNDQVQYSHKNFITDSNTYAIHYATYSWSGDKKTDFFSIIMYLARVILPHTFVISVKKNIIYRRLKK